MGSSCGPLLAREKRISEIAGALNPRRPPAIRTCFCREILMALLFCLAFARAYELRKMSLAGNWLDNDVGCSARSSCPHADGRRWPPKSFPQSGPGRLQEGAGDERGPASESRNRTYERAQDWGHAGLRSARRLPWRIRRWRFKGLTGGDRTRCAACWRRREAVVAEPRLDFVDRRPGGDPQGSAPSDHRGRSSRSCRGRFAQ